MKKVILLAGLLMSSFVSAQTNFKLTVTADEAATHVRFSSLQTFSSMCFYDTRIVSIQPASEYLPGLLQIAASSNPLQPCMMAFGPHSGAFSLPKPVPAGSYGVYINGAFEGFIQVR